MEFTPETFAQIGIQADNLDSITAAINALKEMKKAGQALFEEQEKAAKAKREKLELDAAEFRKAS